MGNILMVGSGDNVMPVLCDYGNAKPFSEFSVLKSNSKDMEQLVEKVINILGVRDKLDPDFLFYPKNYRMDWQTEPALWGHHLNSFLVGYKEFKANYEQEQGVPTVAVVAPKPREKRKKKKRAKRGTPSFLQVQPQKGPRQAAHKMKKKSKKHIIGSQSGAP